MQKLSHNPFSKKGSDDRSSTLGLAAKVGLSHREASDAATAVARRKAGKPLSPGDHSAINTLNRATDRQFRWWVYPKEA